MLKTSCLLLLSIGMLFATNSIAQDKDTAESTVAYKSLETRTATEPESEWPFSHLWQSRYPLKVAPHSNGWQEPITELDFQDSSVYGRVSELRNLSFLTLAEIGNERLFVGFNENGLLGIHFNAFSNRNDRRYLEIVRLPYLNKPDADSVADQPIAESNNPTPLQMTDSW
jgi:hypothetical protein